jgi:hypothetical protein
VSVYRNNVAVTVASAPGTGNITQGSALAGAQSLTTAYGTGTWIVDIEARGTGVWTVERDCSLNGATGVITRGTVEDGSSGPGVRVSLPADTVVRVTVPAGVVNLVDNFLGAWGVLSGQNSITGTATALIGRLNVCSGTTSDYTVTLPAVSGNADRYIGFVMAAGLTRFVTLDGNASETIDGALTRVMWSGETALLYCDGSTWTKVAGRSIALTAVAAPSADQTVTVAGGIQLNLNTSVADNSGRMVETGSNRIRIKRPGLYSCMPVARIRNSTASMVRWYGGMWRTRSGVTTEWVVLAETSVGGAGSFSIASIEAPTQMQADDLLILYAGHSSGTSQSSYGSGTTEGSYLSLQEILTW